MAKLPKYTILFDNGGGATLQTARYCHFYQNAKQLADDVKTYLDERNTKGWDGNEPEYRDGNDTGGRTMDQDDVAAFSIDELDGISGYMQHQFLKIMVTTV